MGVLHRIRPKPLLLRHAPPASPRGARDRPGLDPRREGRIGLPGRRRGRLGRGLLEEELGDLDRFPDAVGVARRPRPRLRAARAIRRGDGRVHLLQPPRPPVREDPGHGRPVGPDRVDPGRPRIRARRPREPIRLHPRRAPGAGRHAHDRLQLRLRLHGGDEQAPTASTPASGDRGCGPARACPFDTPCRLRLPLRPGTERTPSAKEPLR